MQCRLPNRPVRVCSPLPWLLFGLALAGCDASGGAEESGDCASDLVSVETCSPQYAPTFDNIYNNTLKTSCSVGGNACHSSIGQQGGLNFEDIDTAHALLLGSDGRERVMAGEDQCGILVQRLEASDSSVMPPGNALTAEVRCAIRQWIAQGAER